MDQLDRKSFLKAAGVGSAAAAGIAGIPLAQHFAHQAPKELTFRAVTGLPQTPLPSYATQIVEGSVDLTRGSGLVTSRVLAGHPDGTSPIGLPGLARVIRITAIDTQGRGETLRLSGLIEDRSQLRRGESPNVEILIDHKRELLQAPFLGRQIELKLTKI